MLPVVRSPLTRRQFVSTVSGVSLASLATRWPATADGRKPDGIGFIVAGDTHYLADKASPGQMDPRSQEICGRLVDTFNRLPGSDLPAEVGGGKVLALRGLIHVGDIIDTGDKQGGVAEEMQRTEWNAFIQDYGLTGLDGRLNCPTYELHGNHDSPTGTGHVIERIIERNRSRPNLSNVSSNGLHYSWDWGAVHFVNVGLVVGNDESISRKRRYAALDSLRFLESDLRDKVGNSQKPVIIAHHIDITRYSQPCDLDIPASDKEWDPCDVRAFHKVIESYNVIAIFHGHTHVRNVYRWDGQSANASQGKLVLNSDNASHFSGEAQAFFYVELTEKELVVREYQTQDGWKTGEFSRIQWVSPFVPT